MVEKINQPDAKALVNGIDFSYIKADSKKTVLKNVSFPVYENKITALIGPSGCGKTTLLRCFNRMHDLYGGIEYSGQIHLRPSGENILSAAVDPMDVRKKVGMVFQKPNPFPKSIFENVAYGLKIRGIKNKDEQYHKIEESLKMAGLWSEVSDRLNTSAMELSGGQQQRLCIARTLAVSPELLLLDESTSALDPISSAHIEELISELKKTVTILMVTHNLHQAARVSDYTAFMYMGEMVEFGESAMIFTTPKNEKTENYITGRFG